MNTIIALLRGINVGGRNKLPMRNLKTILAEIGLVNVQTYIQSGNVVCQINRTDLPALAEEIGVAIGENHGFVPRILLLTVADLETAVAYNPFPTTDEQYKTLHFYFLESAPTSPDLAKLESIKSESEQFKLLDKTFYLYAPEGIGRSKLATKVERALGVAATARNWRTVSKLLEIATA
ncbi:DUF1697 domain-containing protein [Candidatus Leptofilum sp.]|uniref:DUF1697 domain-containing protein n=1 Tax=Candidatus Leptofilum sp. TaxID=3241576 RepID=UPI003B594675